MRGCTGATIPAMLFSTFLAWAAGPAVTEQPTPTKLEEQVEKRLVQFDVAVEGDPDVIRGITAKDVALYVGVREIQGLIVDPFCGEAQKPAPAPTQQEAPAEQPARPRATFVFFFDQPHLTRVLKQFMGHTPAQIVRMSRPACQNIQENFSSSDYDTNVLVHIR